MKMKEKSWIWYFAWPFAHANYTTVWNTVYFPKGRPPDGQVLAHEQIHSNQQHKWGWFFLPVWIFCYLFILPILWNPFRKKWETEAYVRGSGLSEDTTKRILGTVSYGWLA
jgi:hypothetical protein